MDQTNQSVSFFYFAKRRCPDCDYWPGYVLSGYMRDNIKHCSYVCRQCGKRYTHKHHISLRQLATFVYYSTLLFLPVKRKRTSEHRMLALYAIRDVTESMLRKVIIKWAGLW